MLFCQSILGIGRIRLSVSTASRTYELSDETHVTPFCTYRFHSTGLCNYKPYERTYRRIACCRYGLTARKYWAQSNVFRTYGRVSRGLFLRVRRYGLLYLRTVEYDQCIIIKSGPWFNITMSSYQYRKSHCGDKTILRPSYLHSGISYTGKTASLYWIRAPDSYLLSYSGTTRCLNTPDTGDLARCRGTLWMITVTWPDHRSAW